MFGEVVSSDESQDMSLEAFHVVIVVDLDGGVLDSAVHPLGLTIRPRMVGFRQPMFDAVGDADAVEGMGAEEAAAGAGAVFGQIGEGHTVVPKHGVDLVGKNLHHAPEKVRAFHLSSAVVELDMCELRNPIDGEEHDQLSIGMPQLAAVDMEVTDLVAL